jgi:hypothetical protein
MIVNDANGSLKTMTILMANPLVCIPWSKAGLSMVKLIMWLFMPSDSPKDSVFSPFKPLKQGEVYQGSEETK